MRRGAHWAIKLRWQYLRPVFFEILNLLKNKLFTLIKMGPKRLLKVSKINNVDHLRKGKLIMHSDSDPQQQDQSLGFIRLYVSHN